MEKADRLINKISECQRELAKIQDKCSHSKKDIKFVNYKEGVRWVCRECKSLLGWPEKKELDKWSTK